MAAGSHRFGLLDNVQIKMDIETPAKKVDAAFALCPALMPKYAEVGTWAAASLWPVYGAFGFRAASSRKVALRDGETGAVILAR